MAVVECTDGHIRDVTHVATWSVADPTIAVIDSNAFAWPLNAGTTAVQATYQGLSATGQLTVAPAATGSGPMPADALQAALANIAAPTSLVVSPMQVNLVDPASSYQLLVWGWFGPENALADVTQAAQITISDPTIASVDSMGVVSELQAGTVTITCAWQGQQAAAEIAFGPRANLPQGNTPVVVGNAAVAAANGSMQAQSQATTQTTTTQTTTTQTTTTQTTTPPAVSYATDVLPILQSTCAACHGSSEPALSPYSAAMQFVVAGNPGASLMVQKTQPGGSMAGMCTGAQQTTILQWVADGAAP
jgi:hypothetical protein